MKNKKMSIRILFPLIMSVSIAFCIISCMILFSHYLSAYFIQKTVEDTNRQKNVLAQNIENEIESINDTINTIYYDTIKKYDLQDEAFSSILSNIENSSSEYINGLAYMISTELLYGILRIYQPHLLLRKAGLHKQKIISKQFIMVQRSSSILIK